MDSGHACDNSMKMVCKHCIILSCNQNNTHKNYFSTFNKKPIVRQYKKRNIVENIEDTCSATKKYVLDKFFHENKIFYRDPNGLIISPSIEIVGAYKKKDNIFCYYFVNTN